MKLLLLRDFFFFYHEWEIFTFWTLYTINLNLSKFRILLQNHFIGWGTDPYAKIRYWDHEIGFATNENSYSVLYDIYILDAAPDFAFSLALLIYHTIGDDSKNYHLHIGAVILSFKPDLLTFILKDIFFIFFIILLLLLEFVYDYFK